MRILVTGARGKVGAATVAALTTFGAMPVDSVAASHVEAFKESQLDRGVSARSVVRQLMALSQIFGDAVRLHKLGSNPARAEAVPRPRVRYDRSGSASSRLRRRGRSPRRCRPSTGAPQCSSPPSPA